jgi:citrate lyase beta subunit
MGASLYVPATSMDSIRKLLSGYYPHVKSIILDTEDSIRQEHMEASYENFREVLYILSDEPNAARPMVFLRVRNPRELQRVSSMSGLDRIDGLVYPKFSPENMSEYLSNHPSGLWYMPVLEHDIFTEKNLLSVRDFLMDHTEHLLSVRIGITDILSLLHSRRTRHQTIYQMPIAAHQISRILYAFTPCGIIVNGVICEHFGPDSESILFEEAKADMENGLIGKSAIHPSQVEIIHRAYRVTAHDLEVARQILSETSLGVFKLNDAMQECITHINWARRIISRMETYGVQEKI